MNDDRWGRQGEKKKVDSGQLSVVRKKPEDYFFRASAEDFKKIPGSPIAYWVSDKVRKIFDDMSMLEEWVVPKQGLATGDNGRFTRFWHEVNYGNLTFHIKSYEDSIQPSLKWVPYSKGGGYRKWYGFNEVVVFWENGGFAIREFKDEKGNERSRFRGYDYYFLSAATWGLITSGNFSCRYRNAGYVFDIGGMSAFVKGGYPENLAAMLNTNFSAELLKIINPTLNYQIGDISRLPLECILLEDDKINHIAKQCIGKSRVDWDSFEVSWDFKRISLLQISSFQLKLKNAFSQLRGRWREMTLEMQRLEEENNRIFINAYGLQDELTPEVPLNEITLTCNPHYRYKLSDQWLEASAEEQEAELERRLRQDTIKEFLTYAVGCMFGRYSLDAPGLILANQGENLADYFRIVQEKRKRPEVVSVQSSVISKDNTDAGTENWQLTTDNLSFTDNFQNAFQPDTDNVIPILDGEWFIDDIAQRFGVFLKITFGPEHYEENLKFITDAIGKDIRKYFLKDFYKDHLKTYKKRPIYWLFSSPKGSFNALIYIHRYQPDTVSIILNDYLREFRTKLSAARENLEQVAIKASATKKEKTRALKEIEKIKKILAELDTYENDILYPLATQNIEINLDDGVKVNYKKFGKALKKVPGLS